MDALLALIDSSMDGLLDLGPDATLLVLLWAYLPVYYGLNRLFRMPIGR